MMANSKKDDFYIGWQDEAPRPYAITVRRFLGGLSLLVAGVAVLLVLNQRGFLNSTFELGSLTTVEGVLVRKPVPMLKVLQGVTSEGAPRYQSILLVGFGKHGAEATLENMAAAAGKPLEGQSVQLQGTLIYYGGRAVMELTEGAGAFVGWSEQAIPYRSAPQALGSTTLMGEILDPKCALGVMKPGYGKPHRSCAIRCVSGGIPPVLRVTNEAGEEQHYLVRGEEGQSINQAVLPFIADQLRLCGRLERWDDWLVLYINPAEDILRLQPHFIEEKIPLCSQEAR